MPHIPRVSGHAGTLGLWIAAGVVVPGGPNAVMGDPSVNGAAGALERVHSWIEFQLVLLHPHLTLILQKSLRRCAGWVNIASSVWRPISYSHGFLEVLFLELDEK
jgi:hypothetical protein